MTICYKRCLTKFAGLFGYCGPIIFIDALKLDFLKWEILSINFCIKPALDALRVLATPDMDNKISAIEVSDLKS